MAQPPVSNDESLFARGLGGRLAIRAVTFTILTLGIYAIGRFGLTAGQTTLGMTMVFLVLAVGSMIDIYAIKDRQPLTLASLKRNPVLNGAMLIAIAVVIAIATIPGLQGMFGLVTMPAIAWLIVIPAMFIPTIILEIAKRWQRRSAQPLTTEID